MIFDPQAKLMWHGLRAERWLRTGRCSPILIEVAPTGYCNANCSWCFFKSKQSENHIDPKIMKDALLDMHQLSVKAINWSGGGEPTLHPDFATFVDRAAHYGLKQGLFTNGYQEIPLQSAFEWIRLSWTDEGFNKVKRPMVPFGVCLNQTSRHDKQEIRHICKEARIFGAKYFQIRPAIVASSEEQPALEIPHYLEEYERDDFKVYVTEYKYIESIRPKSYKYCHGYHFCPSIDWNGHLSVCLYLTLNTDFILADLNKENLRDAWEKIPKRAQVITDCQNCCKNHEINKVLEQSMQAEEVDFL